MKRIIVFIFILIFSSFSHGNALDVPIHNETVQVYFSPDGGATDAIVTAINKAKSEILIQAYSD